ncbi:MAG: hypothetical protein QOF48_673, partial [Verrucomicrobiota bacterium]
PTNILVYRFLNNGMPFVANFMGMVVAAEGGPVGSRIQRPSLAVDNFPGVVLGQGLVYLAWSSNSPAGSSIWFSRSLDGANSFSLSMSSPIAAVGAGGNVNAPVVVVGANHDVYVFWLEQTTVGATPNTIKMRRSLNNGDTFAPAVTVATLNVANVFLDGDLRMQSGFRWNSFPQAAANPVVANSLYVAFNDRAAAAGDKADVFLLQSANNGTTWAPVLGTVGGRVNDDSGLNDQYGPSLAVTPDGTKLFVGFYDRRRDPRNINIDTFGRIATITAGSATFGGTRSFRITTEAFPPVTNQDPGFSNLDLADYYMGSYDTAVADNGFFYYTWSDNRLPHTSVGHVNQPDVRFTKIPIAGPGGIIDLFTEGPSGGVVVTGGNGNGIIDFNECNNLTITLINRGNANVVGISATLSSSTPGVTVSQVASLYPDIAAGGTGPSVMPYAIVTGPDFVCGTTIQLKLTGATANAGPFTNSFNLVTGTPGPLMRFDSLDVFPIPIPDNDGTIDSIVHVSGLSAPISTVRARVHILHPNDGNVEISLQGPDGTTIVLSSDNGEGGMNYGTACGTPTIFDDSGATEITFGIPPYVVGGPFRPEQPLAAFTGKSGNGFWKLRVRDDEAGNTGTIVCWGLEIATATCTDGGGPCLQFAGAQVSAGNGNGHLDPNECDNLNVTLRNIRPVAFLGVSAKLIAVTPGVTVVQSMSAYPDIPGNGIGANTTPFKVSISSSVPCGSFVNFILRVTALNDGTFDVPFRLQVGSCAPNPPYTAVSPQVPLLIPDGPGGCVESIIPVSGIIAPIGKVTVSVGIAHGLPSDLVLTLIAPDGTAVVLAANPTGVGNDFGTFTPPPTPFTCITPTTFDDDAGVPLSAGSPPYAGAFMPTGPTGMVATVCGPLLNSAVSPKPLFAFSGKSGPAVNGNWRLQIKDTLAVDVGQLICWSLSICEPRQFAPLFGTLPSKIIDNGTNDISIPVSGITSGISKVRVSMRLTHPRVDDLDISLISPDGTTVNLTSDNGGANMNYGFSCAAPTVFDDDSAISITAAPAVTPFAVGTFRPEDALSAFGGKSGVQANGNWTVRVVDDTTGPAALQQVDCILLDIFAATCVDGGGACAPNRTLTVGSLNPASGVGITVSTPDINGAQNGTTLFTRVYGNGSIVTLTAPLTAPNGNTFVRWVLDGVNQTAGQATLAVTLGADHTAIAVYAGPTVLTVNSLNPGSGVPIMVSPMDNASLADGTTPFSRHYVNGTLVTLTAPATAPNGNIFLRWRIDGVPQGLGVNPIMVLMGADHTATAEYDSPTRLLTVKSEDPDSGVLISPVTPVDVHGNGPGTTRFTREYLTGTSVFLTAPATAPDGSLFKHWEVDGHNFPNGLLTINVVMDVNHTVEAEYESATVELKIKSEDPDHGVPITGVDSGGVFGGVTTFTRVVNRYSTVVLMAPPSANGRLFKRWEVDDDDQPKFVSTVTIFMDEDITAEAEYDGVAVGSIPYSLWFDALDDRVSVPDSASLRITGPITVEALIKRELGNMEQTIVEKSGCPGEAPLVGGYALSVSSGNKLRFQTKDNCSTASSVLGNTSLQPGVWYHVAGVWDGAQLKVYVNGVLDGAIASATNPKAGNTPLLIGSSGNTSPQTVFAGYIDEMRVWNVARIQADIAANRSGCLTGTEPGLAAYWRFNEEDTMVAHDSTPNLNNGMLFNGPIWIETTSGCTTVASPAPLITPRLAPVPVSSLKITMLPDMSGHACRFTIKGPPGQEVLIEVSGDLIHWAPLSCTTNVSGGFELADPMNPNASKRFFRVREE